ncbi:hypothetical protein QE152_g15710 [Popillia japonica]|uniref:C2H2-type domain-containing protein n=1 Tax=Popillia japonica TaxID=7064 RepID=A0AAW1L8U9_POPJA
MLTSSNQYLRPEYLTPLPTTLDAKKSPLALLAQTCSQIGADTPNNKLFQAADKSGKSSSKSDSIKEKVSSDSHKMNLKSYESSSNREKSGSPEERSSSAANRVRTPITSKNHSVNGRCSSNQSAASSRSSPATSERKTPAEGASEDACTPSKSNERTTPHSPSTSSSKTTTSSILTSASDPAIKDLPLGTFKPGALPPSSAFLGAYPPPGIPLGMDLMASSLMSQHHALKSSGLSPYLNYARMKNPSDLVPVCRDPYCTGCSLSSHLLGSAVSAKTASCPAGCTQCDHATSKASSYLGHNPAAAAYAHAQLAALAAASHLPYVCNWISGDASYCGKRFSSSDELLTHLRTHTSVGSVSEASALSMLSASTGLPPTHPLLHRTYPTPPLSPLATARYHPYSKPSLLPPTLTSSPLTTFSLGHPGLPPYLSPYSLYGPRLGATPGMHP